MDMPPNSTSLTMNGLANSKRLSGNTALPSNESYHIATDATQPKEPSRPGRTTSAPVSPPATPSSPLPNGTFSCPSPSRHHTQFSTLLSLPTQPLGLCLPQWHIRFQLKPPCPTRYPRCRPCHSCPTPEHGTPRHRRMVCRPIHRALPLPQMLHLQHLRRPRRLNH